MVVPCRSYEVYGLTIASPIALPCPERGATVLLMASPFSSYLLMGQAVFVLVMVTILERNGRRSA